MALASVPNCLFCCIVAGAIPADVLRSDDDVIVIRDINPQAPVHVLVIPRRHFRDATAMVAEAPAQFGALMSTAVEVACELGLDDGYRVVINTGIYGGQTVDHLHVHVLGGRAMSWPPG